MSAIRVGVAGLGQLSSEVHLPNLRSIPGVSITALADPIEAARSRALTQVPDAAVFSGVEELLVSGKIDALLIATPTMDHYRHALLAVEARIPFYIEKPLASELTEGSQLCEAARRANVVGTIGFNYRFHPAVPRVKASLLGAHRVSSRFTIAPRELPLWKQTRATGGGVLLDLASHHFDLLPYLLRSPVKTVSSTITSERTEQDCAQVGLEFENHVKADCLFSFCRDEQDVIAIETVNGRIEHNRYAPLSYPLWPIDGFYNYLLERRRSPWKEVSFHRSLTAWLDSVRLKQPSPVPLTAGLDVLRIISAAEQSSAQGGASIAVDSI